MLELGRSHRIVVPRDLVRGMRHVAQIARPPSLTNALDRNLLLATSAVTLQQLHMRRIGPGELVQHTPDAVLLRQALYVRKLPCGPIVARCTAAFD